MSFGKHIESTHLKVGIYEYIDVVAKHIQIVKTTRGKISQLDKIEHTSSPGVYILNGINETGQIVVYVGKSGDVLDRVKTHKSDKKKNFFTEVFLITTKDNSFSDAHISYLENFLYDRLSLASNIVINNSTAPARSNVSSRDKDIYSKYGDSIVSIIHSASTGNIFSTRHGKPENAIFELKSDTCDLIGTYDNGIFIIHQGSKFPNNIDPKAPLYVKNIRAELLENGTFVEFEDSLVLTKDWHHDEINRTINILLGKSVTKATKFWRNEDGLTLLQYVNDTEQP